MNPIDLKNKTAKTRLGTGHDFFVKNLKQNATQKAAKLQ